ncbi:MAG TPA: hypothetical protein DEP72_07850 [Clostridiales bacterium]|nr:hypothetical protein [Clostridiales bacterium]
MTVETQQQTSTINAFQRLIHDNPRSEKVDVTTSPPDERQLAISPDGNTATPEDIFNGDIDNPSQYERLIMGSQVVQPQNVAGRSL